MSSFKKLILIILFFLQTLNVSASNIAVIDLEKIINNNANYKEFLKQIEEDQKIYLDNFALKEREIKNLLNEIEKSKLILNENEINIMINNYNEKLKLHSEKYNNFNIHYQEEIIKSRKVIFDKIMILLEEYALNNEIELILDSTTYLIASNSINITNFIENKINEIKINLEFESFE